MVLHEVTLDRRGRLARPGGWLERHNGRQGRVGLLNGRVRPSLEMAAGQVERWRLLNASSARSVRFSIGGAPFRIVGTAGGRIETAVEATGALLAPIDRLDVLVGPYDEGTRLEIQSFESNRGLGLKGTAMSFGSVVVGRDPEST
jgi:FtsP/CotA-like multicopper oxidase with cupredoxin domain